MSRFPALDSERARRLAWLALWLYIAGLGISATLRVQGDFFVYYRTGHRVLHSIPIYPSTDSDRFLYAPIFAIAFAPFALLPRHAAQGAWFIFNAWGLIAFVIGSSIVLFGRSRRLSAATLAVPIVLSFRFIGNNIEHGQINLPVLALCTWAIIYSREDRPMVSGAMIAAAVLIKPFAMIAGLYLVLRRRWRVVGWAIIAGIALFLLPIFVLGPSGLVDQTLAYFRSVSSMTAQYRTMLTNQSAVSAAARLIARFGDPAQADGAWPLRIGMGIEGLLLAAMTLWTISTAQENEYRVPTADRFVLAGFFCLMPAFAPISWKSYFAALVTPYMLLTDELWEKQRHAPIAWAFVVVSAILNFLPGRHLSRFALFYSANFVSSLLVLAAVVSVSFDDRRKHVASAPNSAQADHQAFNATAGPN